MQSKTVTEIKKQDKEGSDFYYILLLIMDMHSRNRYLKQLRIEYLRTKSKRGKGNLLDVAQKPTGLNRKYLMRKLRVISNLDKKKGKVRRRKQVYDG